MVHWLIEAYNARMTNTSSERSNLVDTGSGREQSGANYRVDIGAALNRSGLPFL